jgi:glycosyltransferase involved in cell wall biosynthesis
MVIGSSFYGNTDFEDEFLQELKQKAAPLTNRIIFAGFIPYQHVPDYLACSNVAVIPSVWDDPFPTTVLEAQAMGLPVIATRRGGIPEEVTPETAILLDTDQHFVTNLADTILDLYHHPEKRKAMSQAALEHAKYFNKERYAQDFFAALETTT